MTNEQAAARWTEKAAKQGVGQAQLNIGLMYCAGSGVTKDLILGHMWLNIGGVRREETCLYPVRVFLSPYRFLRYARSLSLFRSFSIGYNFRDIKSSLSLFIFYVYSNSCC
ncbi:MAG: hypothetical protein ACRBDL_00730 [Alphaproteobacteria bacterium]